MSNDYCSAFKLSLIQHLATDTIMCALYSGDAPIGPETTAYTTDGEITGDGYTAGGVTVAISSGYPKIENGRGVVRFEPAVWEGATFIHRKALFYDASRANIAIFVADFGIDRGPTAGTWRVWTPLTNQPLIFLS